MNQRFSTDSFSTLADSGFYGPEVMSTLKRIFDLICKEAEIPVNATAERNWLARHMLAAWSTNPEGQGLSMQPGKPWLNTGNRRLPFASFPRKEEFGHILGLDPRLRGDDEDWRANIL